MSGFRSDRTLKVLRRWAAKFLRETSVEEEMRKSPGASPDDIARRIINKAAFRAGFLGSSVGFMGLEGIFLEALPLTKIQLKLVCDMAALHGIEKKIDFEDADLVLKIFLLAAGIRGGISLAGRHSLEVLSKYPSRVLFRKFGLRLTRRGLLRAIPAVAVAAGGLANYFATRKIGWKARDYFSASRTD